MPLYSFILNPQSWSKSWQLRRGILFGRYVGPGSVLDEIRNESLTDF